MFLASPFAKEHEPGPGHPEQTARYDAALRGLPSPVHLTAPRAATPDELSLCHTRSYLKVAERDVRSGAHYLSTGDTNISSGSFHAAGRSPPSCISLSRSTVLKRVAVSSVRLVSRTSSR